VRIAIASDHAGFSLKQVLIEALGELPHRTIDLGTHSEVPVDYPDFAGAVAEEIIGGGAERGILICGSGVGASTAASKFPGIRAAVCHDCYSARQGVEHDDMNILVLGARVIGPELAEDIVRSFLTAGFSGEERHIRRLKKIAEIESRYGRP
jgi:ribose 5-phosphate isomerase B